MTVSLEVLTTEKLRQEVETSADPTGTPPDWAFVECDTQPSSWTAGAWATAWTGTKADAQTPTIGGTGSGATIELAEGDWEAWLRFTVGVEVVVRRAGRLRMRGT